MNEQGLESEKRQILSEALRFVPSTYVGWLTGLITPFVIRRFLGPHLMGVWSYLQVIHYYGNYGHLGVLSATERELPFCYGKGDLARAATIRETSLFFALATALLTSGAIALYALAVRTQVEPAYFVGLLVVAALAFMGQIGLFLTVLYRSEKRFGVLSMEKVIYALSWLVFSVPLVIVWSIYGLFLAALLQAALSLGYLAMKLGRSLRVRIALSEIGRLLKTGVPLLVLGIGIVSIMNIDRVMIRNLLDSTSLGYYSIAIMAHNFVFSFPNAVSVLMFPRFQHRFGQTQNLADLEPLLRTPLLTMTWAVPVFCGGVFLVLPTVVHYILPRYVPGLEAMKILLVGTSFICLTHMPNQFLITLDKQARTASFLMGLVVVAVGLDYLAIRMGLGIEGVAAATTISYLIYYLGLLAYALKHYTDWAGIARFGLSTLLPACVVFSVLFLSDALLETFLLKLLAFGLPAAFFLWKADRHAGLSPFLLDTLRLKWKGASS